MFSKVENVEKLSSTLKTLQDELRAEVSKTDEVRIKRGMSEDVSVTTPSLEAPSTTPTNVKSIKKTLFLPAEIEMWKVRIRG